ncbi:hypothetical protein CPB84DRAFT_1788403 [Gymnopilus junonius]|uniref:F-box domain-containing protein n=1 Tax=Gymnopilus junonius TaxID=109634 RepID=A0A9P5NFZ9_GYMJU|nr:hypothetical protein CPB84DRAFT_1788403 [Gymnopilus junonius]
MSVLHWSSPIRKCGEKILSPIPNEIYFEIFHHVKSRVPSLRLHPFVKRDLWNMALACRFFCSVALPLVFERLVFVGHRNEASASQNHASFCRSILKRDATAIMMAQNVKSCAFSSWYLSEREEDMEWIFRELFSIYSKGVGFMTNIREISLFLTPVTKELIKTLTDLPHLESLSLTACLPSKDVTNKHLRKLQSLSLKSFSVSQMKHLEDDWWLEFYHQINFQPIVDITTSSWMLCRSLAETDGTLGLEKFDIYIVEDLTVLGLILSKSPSLKVFQNTTYKKSNGFLTLDKIALPHLQHLKAPIAILNTLVPGRPISTIEFTPFEQLEQEQIKCLKFSSRPVTNLSLSATIFDWEDFDLWKQCPHITTLRILLDVIGISDTYMSGIELLSKLRRYPKQPLLHTFIVDPITNNLPRDLQLEHRWLADFVLPQFPALRQCQFGSGFEWFYCHIEAIWRPRVVPKLCEDVLKWARLNQQLDGVDYDGFLKRLLAASD